MQECCSVGKCVMTQGKADDKGSAQPKCLFGIWVNWPFKMECDSVIGIRSQHQSPVRMSPFTW